MLILSVVHVPLPQADYHNVRHHHARGEVCVYHDHLLRWHPSAGSNDDVALLHWHWFVPVVSAGGEPSANDEERGPGSGPALHAHLGDSLEPTWPTEPVIGPERCGRFHGQLALAFATPGIAYVSNPLPPLDPNSLRFSGSHLGCASELRAARIVLFQRWNC